MTITQPRCCRAQEADHFCTGIDGLIDNVRIRDSAALSEVSAHDASAREGSDAAVEFVVVLEPASTGMVTVDYATSDGTATAGDDYLETSGTLTFDAGQTFMFVRVRWWTTTRRTAGRRSR